MLVEIQDSKIHGKGAFAIRDIKKDEVIWKWDLSVIVTEEDQHFVCKYDQGRYVVNQAPYRFINHSCAPNVKTVDFSDIAIRDIKAGEELTSDYADDNDGSLLEFACFCGAPNCRGRVLATTLA